MITIARKANTESWEIVQASGETCVVNLELMGMNMLFDNEINIVRINESTYRVDYNNKILKEI